MQTAGLACAAVLGALLVVAAVSDIRTRRIPNALVAAGMLTGVAVQWLTPDGSGLFAFWWGGLGPASALFGLLAGLALFMPLHLLRVVGAGDVKLLAMVGTWLGPQALLGATLATLVAGGLMALSIMAAKRSARTVLGNVRLMLTTAMLGLQAGTPQAFDRTLASGIRMPYAVAIALGTLTQVAWLLAHASP